jgi:hypothetical protein
MEVRKRQILESVAVWKVQKNIAELPMLEFKKRNSTVKLELARKTLGDY